MIERIETLTDEQVRQLHALYQNEWWSEGRELLDVYQMLEHSDIIIAFVERDTDSLVAFARLLTDTVFQATLYDVNVAPANRNQGLGRRLMDAVVDHSRLRSVQKIWLCCLPEMAPSYEQWDFADTVNYLKWMRRLLPQPCER